MKIYHTLLYYKNIFNVLGMATKVCNVIIL